MSPEFNPQTDVPVIISPGPVDPFIPGSVERPCDECDATTLVAPSSLRLIESVPRAFNICLQCLHRLMGDPKVLAGIKGVGRAPGADDELRAAGLEDVADDDTALTNLYALFLAMKKGTQ